MFVFWFCVLFNEIFEKSFIMIFGDMLKSVKKYGGNESFTLREALKY